MDSSSLSKRDIRRKAAATRRAARENGGGLSDDGSVGNRRYTNNHYTPRKAARQYNQTSFLSSLSQALSNIDKHNNSYFSAKSGDADGNNGYDSETITFSSPNRNSNTNNNNSHVININTPDSSRKKMYNKSRLPSPPTHFSSYMKFNRLTIKVFSCFISCYLLVLICCYPMIKYSNIEILPTDDDFVKGKTHHIKKGASFAHIRGRNQYLKAKYEITSKLGTLKERAIKWEEEAKLKAKQGAVEIQETEKEIIDSIASGTIGRRDGNDAKQASSLLEEAIHDFDNKRLDKEDEDDKRKAVVAANNNIGGHDHWKDALDNWDKAFILDNNDKQSAANVDPNAAAAEALRVAHKGKTPGFMVLGMHRSGTSMLSGLLVKGFGYETGGPLIGASFDNEKGFYERIDIVLQNDEFMAAQRSGWSWNVLDFDPEKALEHKKQGRITFKEGKKGLKFLNNHFKTLPYLQKDPRMCLVLPTWLKLVDDQPAIVFTYRHPLEVALSLKHREQNFTIEHGLRLWIVYNMRALQYSEGLCRVFSTNEAVFKDPRTEVQRIKDELTKKCKVIPPPILEISSQVVNEFVDPKLQHNKKEREAEEKKQRILKDYGNRCVAREFESEYEEQSANRRAEIGLYLMAMQVFCDLENGKAYKKHYEWPDLEHWQRPARIS